MQTRVSPQLSSLKSRPRRKRRAAWGVIPLAAISVLSNCTTGKDAEIVANLIFQAGRETAEEKEYERKEVIKAGGHSFLVQKHRTTGAYSIVDPRGQRHNCLGKDCLYTATQVAGELPPPDSKAEGGGGSGGGE